MSKRDDDLTELVFYGLAMAIAVMIVAVLLIQYRWGCM